MKQIDDSHSAVHIQDEKPLKRRITISVISQLVSQIVSGLMGVVVLKLMTTSLGKQEYGTYATIFAFISTFALLTDLGINTITTREIAKHPDQASSIISHNLGMRIALSLVTIPLISGLGFIFYPNASHDLRFGILTMSFFLIFDVIWAVSAAYFTARVRSDIPAKNAIIQQIVFLLGVIIVSVIGGKLFGYIAAYVVSIAIGSFIILLRVRKRINVRPRVNLTIWRNLISSSIALGVISIINTLYIKADSVMISVLNGSTAVGIYGVAYLLVNVFAALPGYIMAAIAPSMAVAKKDEFESLVHKAFQFMAVISCILLVGSFFIRKEAVLLVSNKDFIDAATPFAVLSIATVFSYFSRVAIFACIAIDKHHKYIYLSIGTLVLNILLNLVFIPRYGITGAAWATVITELLGMFVGYMILRSQTGIIYKAAFLIRPLAAACIVSVIGFLISANFHTYSPFVNCLIIGFGVTIPYFVLLYLFNGMPADMNDVVQKNIEIVKTGVRRRLRR